MDIIRPRLELVDKFMSSSYGRSLANPTDVKKTLEMMTGVTSMLIADMSDEEVNGERVGYWFSEARNEWKTLKIILDRYLPEKMAQGVRRNIRSYAVKAMRKYGEDIDGFEELLTSNKREEIIA